MKKGIFGYLRKKRTLSLIKSALLLSAVFIIYFCALRHFHTNRNIFSIVAAALALPAARSVVVSILCLRAKSASDAVRELVDSIPGVDPRTSGYDLYLTSYDNAFSISHAAVGNGRVAALTESPQTDCRLCAQHISELLKKDGHTGYDVTVYADPARYREALSELTLHAGQDGRAEEDHRTMLTLYAIAL